MVETVETMGASVEGEEEGCRPKRDEILNKIRKIFSLLFLQVLFETSFNHGPFLKARDEEIPGLRFINR